MEALSGGREIEWSGVARPLDLLVTTYRLPQLVRLENGETVEGIRENDLVLLHSCRQWTTITAHSLEEGHYVIGPKIEIPVHYGGQFKLLEQDRDIKEPIQYFSSVEEVAKAFPERVYVMEDITFNVKVASGECNEDTEVYNITLSTGDELTLMGQAEILYAKTSKEKSRLNTIFKKIGKLNSIGKLGRGKMPCLICMNHRTNESISLPFQCKGRLSTRSPLEIQMQEGEHTIRNIVEKTRLPVNVTVPSAPPRNPYDLHLIREGHRYKFVNIQTKTVVVCCVLRNNKMIPMHFPLHLVVPKFTLAEGLLKGEMWYENTVQHSFNICQEQFDIEEYSRAVRDVKTDWNEDCKSPKKTRCTGHSHMPNSLSYAREELTQSFHRLSVCVYGNNLHGNSEVNLHGCRDPNSEWTLFSHETLPSQDSGDSGSDYLLPEVTEEPAGIQSQPELPYEELWLDQGTGKRGGHDLFSLGERLKSGQRASVHSKCLASSALSSPGPLSTIKPSSDISLPPPPVPPKSEAVKEECRLLNAPPVPPRNAKPSSQSPSIPPRQIRQQTRSPSPTLSYYSSGLHNIGATENDAPPSSEKHSSASCYPCNWINSNALDSGTKSPLRSPILDCPSNRSSWPNQHFGDVDQDSYNFGSEHRSYYSYPRHKIPSTPKSIVSVHFQYGSIECAGGCEAFPVNNFAKQQQSKDGGFHFVPSGCPRSTSYSSDGYREKYLAGNTRQSQSCPILPPRALKFNDEELVDLEALFLSSAIDGAEDEPQICSTDLPEDNFGNKDAPDTFSIPSPPPPLHLQLLPRSSGDGSPWQPPSDLCGLSIEEVSKCLQFIGLPEEIMSLFATEKIDGNLLVQLTEEILSEDFKLSKLQIKKLLQFIGGWRPKM
ncbi:GRB2-associated and regulator of MAPK protein 1 isoform X1 [Carcharodon carcharias]|uniref:GRB2-associated and regulator of MAPK protein 1 isoform X1 n=2 Tax=Carcharodon carcharias TaxID=13397 RepID=UPI001B7E07CE|nr:GRB2-associated and regulator of MAPK protein 1 isoform X1 [Carcharodon carcharias]